MKPRHKLTSCSLYWLAIVLLAIQLPQQHVKTNDHHHSSADGRGPLAHSSSPSTAPLSLPQKHKEERKKDEEKIKGGKRKKQQSQAKLRYVLLLGTGQASLCSARKIPSPHPTSAATPISPITSHPPPDVMAYKSLDPDLSSPTFLF